MEVSVEIHFGNLGTDTLKTLWVIRSEVTKAIVITSGVLEPDTISLEEWRLHGNTSISILIRTHMAALGVNSLWLQDWLCEMAKTLLLSTENY